MTSQKVFRYKTSRELGRALGLSDIEMELVHQKKILIERIKEARLKKELSQTELASLVGSRQPAIARMESGQISEVSMDFLLKASLALELTVTIKSSKKVA